MRKFLIKDKIKQLFARPPTDTWTIKKDHYLVLITSSIVLAVDSLDIQLKTSS